MIKNIIFDIGNVLLDFKPIDYLHKKEIELNKINDVHTEIFQSEEWLMLDRGVITEAEAIKVLATRSHENAHLIENVFENWYEMLTPIETSIQILKQLKTAGYHLYFLSNFHLLAFEEVNKQHDFFQLFDGGVVSYQEKLLKPENDIYTTLINRYGLNPKESIFIDDTLENINAASNLNLETIHFQESTDLKLALEKFNINITK